MKASVKITPYMVIESSKELIFYMPKKSDTAKEISA